MAKSSVKVGLLGLGTVGGGVARLLMENKDRFSRLLGAELELARAVDLDPALAEGLGLAPGVFGSDASALLDDPSIDVVVELIGGLEPARTFVLQAIAHGKQVATANKALLAHHGLEIISAARANKVGVSFEASVGGGIPLVRALRDSLAANNIAQCLGILNGTCNYILTRMASEGAPFEAVLAEAQQKGYAEADPKFDVQGMDTAHKLAIITALVTGAQPSLEDIPCEGITDITPLDLQFADEFGFKVKLLALLRNNGHAVEARVHPTLVPHNHMLASVDGVFNALHLTGDWVGDVLLYGRGAGSRPTASAVVGDVLELARDVVSGTSGRVPPLGTAADNGGHLTLAPLEDSVSQYYFRFSAEDRPGVLAEISRILGENDISIEAVLQKGRHRQGPVPIVMLTHEAREAGVSRALKQIDGLGVITQKTLIIRVA